MVFIVGGVVDPTPPVAEVYQSKVQPAAGVTYVEKKGTVVLWHTLIGVALIVGAGASCDFMITIFFDIESHEKAFHSLTQSVSTPGVLFAWYVYVEG